MKYYLHSVDTMDDEKVSQLFKEFGYEGTGLFHAILEKLAKQEKPIKTDVLKYQLKVGKRLEKCWQFMESLGIISSNNGDTFNKQLLNYAESYQIKKEKTAKKVAEWREKQTVKESVTNYETVSNSPKVNKSKVKVYKEEKVNTKIVEKTPIWPQRDFIEIYDQFVKKIIDVPAKIDGVQIKAGRQIFSYLKTACQQKQGQSDDETVLNSWRYILDNYNRWDPFHQDRTKLTEINSNIQNIAKTLKNGKSTGKNQPATSFEQIDRLAAAVFRCEPL